MLAISQDAFVLPMPFLVALKRSRQRKLVDSLISYLLESNLPRLPSALIETGARPERLYLELTLLEIKSVRSPLLH